MSNKASGLDRFRIGLAEASLWAGTGAAAFLAARPLHAHFANFESREADVRPLAILLVSSLVLGTAGILLGVTALAGKRRRAWKSFAGIALGLTSVAFPAVTALAEWRNEIPPDIDDLNALRDRAVPVIEEITGMHFKQPVALDLTSSLSFLEPAQNELRQSLDKPDQIIPLDYSGLYERGKNRIHIFPDGISRLRRGGALQGSVQAIACAALIHELVHAIDDQNALLLIDEQQLSPPESRTSWLIHRAIEEGHANYVGDEACRRLGLYGYRHYESPAPRDSRPDAVTDLLATYFTFFNTDGSRFFEHLQKYGGTSTIVRALRSRPLFLHHIRHPEIYLRDTTSGKDRILSATCARLPRLLEANGWRSRTREPGKLEESDCLWPRIAADESDRMKIAFWIDSYGPTEPATGQSLLVRLSRYPGAAEAGKALDLVRREQLKADDRADQEKAFSVVERPCPGIDAYLFAARVPRLTDTHTRTMVCRGIAQAGEFILDVSCLGTPHVDDATTLCDLLMAEILAPLGLSATPPILENK